MNNEFQKELIFLCSTLPASNFVCHNDSSKETWRNGAILLYKRNAFDSKCLQKESEIS